jgi:DNA-directed RNA polymerase subunit beta'
MKGPAGIIIINNMLPQDVRFPLNQPVDSAVFRRHMQKFAKKYPQMYAQKISQIAHIGEKMTFYLGGNVGPKDLKIKEADRKKLVSKIEKKIDKAKSNDEKREILLSGLKEATSVATKAAPMSNEMIQQVKSGSRGKPVQFARMSVGPIYAVDMNQLPKPNLIRNSFTGGLTAHEYFNVASQGRYSSVQAANATSEPGALGKILIANSDAQKVTTLDCGTQNGVMMSVNDHHILGRFEAGTNKLIDEAYVRQLKSSGKKKIKVRSPITCQAKKGVCAKCYGLKPDGRLPSVGDNVGIKAAQTIGEILTQMTLSTKHSTMGKSDSNKLSGVEGFKIITNSPSSFAGAAVVATDSGVVTRVDKAPQGGHFIFVGNKKYTAKPHAKVKVSPGDSVFRGQPLTDGVITPKHIMETRGIGEARVHEAGMLHSLFKDSTGRDLQKKHFELIARGHLSLGRNDIGDIDEHSSLMDTYPKRKSKAIVGNMIIGKYLANDYGQMFKGTQIDGVVLKELKNMNISSVEITDEAPKVKPIFKSMEQKPSFSGNLFSKMNYRNLSKAIKDEIMYNKKPSKIGDYTSDRANYTANML